MQEKMNDNTNLEIHTMPDTNLEIQNKKITKKKG